MKIRLVVAGAVGAMAAVAALLTGCQSSVDGTATRNPDSFGEPNFPTPRPSRPTTASSPPPTPSEAPPPAGPTGSRPPGGEQLAPENGLVFIQTKSGKTRCQLEEQEVDCESAFTDTPEVDGQPANGVRLSPEGQISWVVGNLGAIPAVTLEYRTYSAVGWTIEASEDGTRITNDGTGRGMNISIEGVEGF